MELDSNLAKSKFLNHIEVASWFEELKIASNEFICRDRIVWVDIEGIPMKALTKESFAKIATEWGSMMDIEDSVDVIIQGKVFMVRAKELYAWTPIFKEEPKSEYYSDNESIQGVENLEEGLKHDDNSVEDKDELDAIFEIDLENEAFLSTREKHQPDNEQEPTISEDPFLIYKTLKNMDQEQKSQSDQNVSFPPGFTPIDIKQTQEKESHVVSSLQKAHPEGPSGNLNGGSILEVMDNMVKLGLTHKTKKDWVRELCIKNKVNSISLQETKMESMSQMDVKILWGNNNFDYVVSDSLGNSGGMLCVWETNVFHKENVTISDNFMAIYGRWLSNNTRILLINVYASQNNVEKRVLWDYILQIKNIWDGECIIMGDFNEVRTESERFRSVFHKVAAQDFNNFISGVGLKELTLDGYSFTWAHKSASKMSKLDRFLISKGILVAFPQISAFCLDRHLSDHRPILIREVSIDYGPTPFHFFHSWLHMEGFEDMIKREWSSMVFHNDNKLVKFKLKLQQLKKVIRTWNQNRNKGINVEITKLKTKLGEIDKLLYQGQGSSDVLKRRLELMKDLDEKKKLENLDNAQKAKVKWLIEGDENSKFFHGIINKKRANLAIRGMIINGERVIDPTRVKEECRKHFSHRILIPPDLRCMINFPFPNQLNADQRELLDGRVSRVEIKKAAWDCGVNKSLGPDGFTFEFFRCNSSFIALIPKIQDAKHCSDYRPITLIGSMYKVISKILANRIVGVIPELISDVQTAFLAQRKILDGPFILNELLTWCKKLKKQAMIFKVDFAKAFDSVRWDFLDDVLLSFGFGVKWRRWVKGCLSSAMASILVNESPSAEFTFERCLKQGDPLSPYLFILVMESLNLSLNRVIADGIYSGVGVHPEEVNLAANLIGCSVLKLPFNYLGVMIGVSMSHKLSWAPVIQKIQARLSKWKAKTLSIGGRFTLLKSVFGATPIYNMSIYKVPMGILDLMESIRSKFFSGAVNNESKISWVPWKKVLAAKEHGGLGVSSFWALNRALLCKWFWRFLNRDNSLWLYALENNKSITVADKMVAVLEGSFRRCVRSGVESEQLANLRDILDSCSLSSQSDRWYWDLNGYGEFLVKDVRNLLDAAILPLAAPTRWVKYIPIKINIFAWKVSLDRIPTKINLLKRGVSLECSLCPLCNEEAEDTSHILFKCEMASTLHQKIKRFVDGGKSILLMCPLMPNGYLGSNIFIFRLRRN
nr:putative RNA-directed DNA polymerase, eukaryota, reverse transcriptase zinc-binding domain protein [Tanacetum cinerariifolium]